MRFSRVYGIFNETQSNRLVIEMGDATHPARQTQQ
jgi:hypothetical protein